MFSRLLMVIVLTVLFIFLYEVDKNLTSRGSGDHLRQTLVPASDRSRGREDSCKREQATGSCPRAVGASAGTGDTNGNVSANAARVLPPPRGDSNSVLRSEWQEIRVLSTPRRIDLGGPVDVKREISTCMDYESQAYCESKYPNVSFDKGAGIR